MPLKVLLSDVGNPDYRQDADRSVTGLRPRWVKVTDFAEASRVCREYIDNNNLGGGNWSGGLITEDGKEVARVAYGGSVWSLPQRVGDKPIWPKTTKTASKNKTIDGVEPLEWESETIEIPNYGMIKITGCYRMASCETVPGQFKVDGKRMDFSTYMTVTRDGIEDMPCFNLHPDGQIEKEASAPKGLHALVLKTLRDWTADPANAGMFLRNQFADERHDLQVMERNIRYTENELEKKRAEANAKRNVVEGLRTEIEGHASRPKL